LVIEVKHYKRSAARSFGDVLNDYARAFPKAEVYLVNHGSVSGATTNLPRELLRRCNTIGDLTVSHIPARGDLRKAVREDVGEPVARPAAATSSAANGAAAQIDTVLAVDISESMASLLRSPDFFEIVREVADARCGNAALVDVGIRALVPLDELPEAITSARGSSTHLDAPVRELLGTFKRVLVVTDDDGVKSLKPLPNQKIISKRRGLVAVEVLTEYQDSRACPEPCFTSLGSGAGANTHENIAFEQHNSRKSGWQSICRGYQN
jgi:hypothetical protein